MRKKPARDRPGTSYFKEVLESMGLHLGMQVEGWPPENIDALAKGFDEPF